MNLDKIAIGKNPPQEVNVIIEISAGSTPVKYEFNKEAGAIEVDRFVATPMFYPANYGFIPHTMGDDGDPLDALVITPHALVHGCVIAARPLGMLKMEDDGGMDEKILMVPTPKLCGLYDHMQDIDDVPALLKDQIEHFFMRYKDLEKGKWAKMQGWQNRDAAYQLIEASIET